GSSTSCHHGGDESILTYADPLGASKAACRCALKFCRALPSGERCLVLLRWTEQQSCSPVPTLFICAAGRGRDLQHSRQSLPSLKVTRCRSCSAMLPPTKSSLA